MGDPGKGLRRGDDPTAHSFGQRVKKRRRDAGLTRIELASRAGLSRSYLARLERGEANPTLEVMAQLATAVGRKLADLLATDP